jgi:hypothetical protein
LRNSLNILLEKTSWKKWFPYFQRPIVITQKYFL